MAKRVVLHIGAMKSGTTYLQAALYANRDHLADRGVLLPGKRWGRQVDGVLDVLGLEHHPTGRSVAGNWAKLADQVRDWSGTAVISVELLAPAGPRQIKRIAESLGRTKIDVVVTLRDLNRTIPAMWQESIQNGRSWLWDDYIADVERGRPRRGRTPADVSQASQTFWRQQNAVRLANLWSKVGRVHLVTVPHPGAPADLLMSRFADVVGFDHTTLEAAARANTSLGAASTEALRLMNLALDERDLRFPAGIGVRKRHLAKSVLPERAGQEPRIGAPLLPWVAPYARFMVRSLKRQRIRLHGDWADLEPTQVAGIHPSEVTPDQVAAAAVDGYRGLSRILAALTTDAVPEWAPEATDPAALVTESTDALADLVEWYARRPSRRPASTPAPERAQVHA